MIIKNWVVTISNLTEADVHWLSGCCNNLYVESKPFNNLRNPCGEVLQIPVVRVETINDDQEAMLKLKYEGQLTLMTVVHTDDLDYYDETDYSL
jgi:hypothetical protein